MKIESVQAKLPGSSNTILQLSNKLQGSQWLLTNEYCKKIYQFTILIYSNEDPSTKNRHEVAKLLHILTPTAIKTQGLLFVLLQSTNTGITTADLRQLLLKTRTEMP